MTTSLTEIFKWRKPEDSVPIYGHFGCSNEVIGVDEYNTRRIYVYNRGEWYYSTDYSSNSVTPPIYWHYLPRRILKQQEQKETYDRPNSIK